MNLGQIGIAFGQDMRRNPRAGQLGSATGRQAITVAPGPAPGLGLPEFTARRGIEHSHQGPPGTDQGDRNRPAWPPRNKIAGPIDRIDQPDQSAVQPFGRINGFLGKPPGRGQQRAQLSLQKLIDRQIGRADRAAAVLVPHFERMAMAGPGCQRDLPGLPDDRFKAGAVNHAAKPALLRVTRNWRSYFSP